MVCPDMYYFNLQMSEVYSIFRKKRTTYGPIHISYHRLDLLEAFLLKESWRTSKVKLDMTRQILSKASFDSENIRQHYVHESHGQVFWGLWCYHNIDCIDHHTMPSVTFCNIDYCLSHDHSFPYYLFRNIINLWNNYPLCSPDSLMSRNSLEIRTLRGRAWEVLGRGMQPVTAGP